MEKLDTGRGPSHGLSRRTIVKSAAWSIPVVAAAAATPMSAASGACTLNLSTETAAYARVDATAAQFTWTNPFGDGKDLTLSLGAAHIGVPEMDINTAANLVQDFDMHGGEAKASVHLALNTLGLVNNGGGERVTFAFALGGAATTVDNLSYKIKDIDGFQAADGNGGAERVSVTAGTGTYDPAWITGSGVPTDRWRLTPSIPNANSDVPASSSVGNVGVSAGSVSSFSLDFIVNNSGRSANDRPPQNIWVGPFTFAVSGICKP